jgi:hypothetical protein
MDTLIVPDLAMLRRWLEQLSISCFECDACEALHLPHMQSVSGIFDAKIDLADDIILFSALAEIRPSALMKIIAELSQLNASSLTMKVFIDVQDDNLPKLVLCQSLSISAGVSIGQFNQFLLEAEEQTASIILEVQSNGWLLNDDDDNVVVYTSVNHQIH